MLSFENGFWLKISVKYARIMKNLKEEGLQLPSIIERRAAILSRSIELKFLDTFRRSDTRRLPWLQSTDNARTGKEGQCGNEKNRKKK